VEKQYDVVKSFARGRRHRVKRLEEERILSGSECWFQSSDSLMILDGGRYRAELYSFLTLAMPLAIQTERFDDIRYGERTGDPLAYIYLDKQDSLLVVLGIDREDYMIRSSEGIVRQGDQSFVFVNRFTDYQRREGFFFAGGVTTISLGLEVASAKLKAVEVNSGLDDEDFKP
jgi:hypothetical protein